MALYFYFNETTGDLVYSDQATYSTAGYTSLGEQMKMNPIRSSDWVFDSQRSDIKTVSKDPAIVGKITGLTKMVNMFNSCRGLTSLDLSGFDTSAVTDMGGMFNSCVSLTNLDLSGFDTSAVTNMGNMFYLCSGLTSLDLSGFDTSAVTDMGHMFNACVSLTNLDLSGFDTSAVTNMGYMFNSCASFTSLDLSDFDTSSVTYMSGMFYSCSGLTSLDLSGFDTSAVTDMEHMFNLCSSLTSLDISGFDTSAVTAMGNMFDNCNSLRLVTISGKMSNIISQLPATQYYPAAGGDPVAKASLTAGAWVRDEADLSMVTSIVAQGQMSQAISRRIGKLGRYLRDAIDVAKPSVDIVRTDAHSTSYTKDTLEIITNSSGKVTEMWFVTAD